MSDLLSDSPTSLKYRDRILAELSAGEQVMYVVDAIVNEPTGGPTDFNLYIGAIIVTNERLLVVEGKALGRVAFHSVAMTDLEKMGRGDGGTVLIKKSVSSKSRWPLWEIQIWEGKSFKTPLDKQSLDLLAMSIQDAHAAVAASRDAEVGSAYEELKRRRGM